MTHAFAGMGVPLLPLIFLSAWLLLYAMVSGWLPVAMDKPNGRSLHQIPTPRTGGLAICLALVIGLPWLDGREVQAMAYGALLLGAVSLADDFWDLSPLIRFPLHLLVALCAVAYVQPSQEIWIMAVSVLAIAWMTNLFNFMDGSNGLAGGMALIGFGAYAWACLHAGAGALGLLTASVAVSAFAFLLFNFHPARIFMGDTGAIPLGFLAGLAGYLGWANGVWPIWFPMAVFSPFIVDASTTLLKRALMGKKVWQAHREHYYQRLIQMGWSHRCLALWEYVLMAASSGSALFLLGYSHTTQFLWLAGLGIVYMVLMVCIDYRWRAYVAQEVRSA